MRFGFLLAWAGALLALPFLAYSAGVPADDDLSQHYLATVGAIRYHIATFDPKANFEYEKAEIPRTLGQAKQAVVTWVSQKI